jgi:hypothetical protein
MVAIETPHGPAQVRLQPASAAGAARAALVLGHGAGGGIDAPDLTAASAAAAALGVTVALVEQPYRVAGRRSPAPAHQLDAAWLAVLAALRADQLAGLALFAGGRSSGARVACRTAAEAGLAGVICLAFPLHPPGKGGDPAKSRLGELAAVRVPVLVVQGERDPFGMPPAAPGRSIARIAGDHSLRGKDAVAAAVSAWLRARLDGL